MAHRPSMMLFARSEGVLRSITYPRTSSSLTEPPQGDDFLAIQSMSPSTSCRTSHATPAWRSKEWILTLCRCRVRGMRAIRFVFSISNHADGLGARQVRTNLAIIEH